MHKAQKCEGHIIYIIKAYLNATVVPYRCSHNGNNPSIVCERVDDPEGKKWNFLFVLYV